MLKREMPMPSFVISGTAEDFIKANEENFLSYTRTYASINQNYFLENKKVMLSLSKVDGVSMINNCVSKSCMEEIDIRETLNRFKAAGRPVMWTIFPSTTPDDIEKILIKCGMVHLERNSLMYFDMTTLEENLNLPENLVIKQVNNIKALKEWARLNAIGFGLTDGIKKITIKGHADLFINKSIPGRHFVAYLNNKPVGTSSVFMANGVAGLYNITTLPEARGRGIGESITKYTMLSGKKSGYVIATLQATKKGLPVYEKIGFKSSCYMDFYLKMYGLSLIKIPFTSFQRLLGNFLRRIFCKV